MDIQYDNGRMVFPGIDCSCGCVHNIPDLDVYVGSGILKNSAEYINRRNLGRKAVLVADNITYGIAGRYVEKLLTDRGFLINTCLLERKGELEPDETALGEVLLTMDKGTEFLISVGSGSITDTTRYVAFNTGRPFVSIGTAPSMDGYTSVVAPLLFRGMKVNKPAACPPVIICDLDIMKSAPAPMFISGFGDVMGKYIAKADWVLGNIVNNEPYCPKCAELVLLAVKKCLDNIDDIRTRTETGTKVLIEALILAGATIMIVGNTRAVASVEHNMAHYWEMMKLAAGEKPPAHGTAVGVGTVYSLLFFEQFIKMGPYEADKARLQRSRQTRLQREEFMVRCYGKKTGSVIIGENPEDFLDWAEQERRIDTVREKWGIIKEALAFLPSPGEMSGVLRRLGAPVTAEEIGIDGKLLKTTLECAKDYRSRYNVCKTLEELGMLDEAIKEVLRTGY